MAKSKQALFESIEVFDDRPMHPGKLIAGVDEAGRGPLAGPVVAAAVILDPKVDLSQLPNLGDSKVLTREVREQLEPLIRQCSLAVGVGICDEKTIDEINILQASLQAMVEAVAALEVKPDLALVDGNQKPGTGCPSYCMIGGDGRSASIAAASIIAKVTRDRIMREFHSRYPCYGFHRHKGYCTAFHLAALDIFGPCRLHRRSFMPVQAALKRKSPTTGFLQCYEQINLLPRPTQPPHFSIPPRCRPKEKYYLEKLFVMEEELVTDKIEA